ncbi:MAG TPA: substrate-binding domain-containing protein [Gemmatimonadaceae bacterium]
MGWRCRGVALLAILAACTPRSPADTLVVFTAGSLARPMRAALDTFAAREGIRHELESAGSLETARKLTELGKIPDVVALADEDVFPKVLMPAHTTWYVRFAENRIVLAFTDRSRFAAEIDSTNWWRVLQRPDLEIGRSNPDLDPSGYRTLMVFQLAERFYGQPGLANALERAADPRNMRPKEIELVALLESGDLDYAWFYESMARASGVRHVTLPAAIDLGSADLRETYRQASVRVLGASAGDTVTMQGAPIRYAFSIPLQAPNPGLAERFAAFLLSVDGRRVLEREHLAALPAPDAVGTGVPESVRPLLGR